MVFWCAGDGNWHNRKSLDEFGFGEHAACGPAAHELVVANLYNRAPTYGYMRGIMQRDKQRGWYRSANPNAGQTFTEVLSDFTTFDAPRHTYNHLIVHGFHDNGYSQAEFVTALEQCRGNNAAMIVQVKYAYKLPHNEAGVHEHFIAVVAYDSTSPGKVLVCNPDREPHSTSPDWLRVTDIMAAVPQAMLVVVR